MGDKVDKFGYYCSFKSQLAFTFNVYILTHLVNCKQLREHADGLTSVSGCLWRICLIAELLFGLMCSAKMSEIGYAVSIRSDDGLALHGNVRTGIS